jgi:ribosome assembly protein 1
MYLSVITTTAEALGGTYSVLGRRRAKILSESIREGTGVFIIHSYLPVAQSFGFADELRQMSSGKLPPNPFMLLHWYRWELEEAEAEDVRPEDLSDSSGVLRVSGPSHSARPTRS